MAEYGWEQWQWDESLFAGAAPYYSQGRTPYAPGLERAVEAALGLDGGGRLLDVGCGPGTIACRLASLFEEVVGLDPDAGMLAEARAQDVANTRWVKLRAEELPADLGTFRVICFAASFHWMDRPLVARTVRGMLEPDGAVIQVGAATGGMPPSVEDAVKELTVRFLGPNRRAGKGLRNSSPSGEDEIFQAAGFLPQESHVVSDGRVLERSTEDVVACVFSTSSTAPHLFGDQLPAFERELRALLHDVSPAGVFPVTLGDNELRVWRLPR